MIRIAALQIIIVALMLVQAIPAQANTHVGFVKGIWFDPYPFFTDEIVHIHSVIFNQSDQEIEGALSLFIDESVVAQDEFIIPAGSTHQPLITYTFPSGVHDIYLLLQSSNEETDEVITIDEIIMESMMIDNDYDKDRVGDLVDNDDDGDGFTDLEELQIGSNPLDTETTPITVAQTLKEIRDDAKSNSNSSNSDNSVDSNDQNFDELGGNTNTDETENSSLSDNDIVSTVIDATTQIAQREEEIRNLIHETLTEIQTDYRDSLLGISIDSLGSSSLVSEETDSAKDIDLYEEALELERSQAGSPLRSSEVGAVQKTLYAGLSFLSFLFSRWWILFPFIAACIYGIWKLRALWKEYYSPYI